MNCVHSILMIAEKLSSSRLLLQFCVQKTAVTSKSVRKVNEMFAQEETVTLPWIISVLLSLLELAFLKIITRSIVMGIHSWNGTNTEYPAATVQVSTHWEPRHEVVEGWLSWRLSWDGISRKQVSSDLSFTQWELVDEMLVKKIWLVKSSVPKVQA